MRIILICLLLSACAHQNTFEFVKAQDVEEVRQPQNCGFDVLPNYGCWRTIDIRGGCKIIVVWPNSSGDGNNLQTLGLEVWKCVENNKEY